MGFYVCIFLLSLIVTLIMNFLHSKYEKNKNRLFYETIKKDYWKRQSTYIGMLGILVFVLLVMFKDPIDQSILKVIFSLTVGLGIIVRISELIKDAYALIEEQNKKIEELEEKYEHVQKLFNK